MDWLHTIELQSQYKLRWRQQASLKKNVICIDILEDLSKSAFSFLIGGLHTQCQLFTILCLVAPPPKRPTQQKIVGSWNDNNNKAVLVSSCFFWISLFHSYYCSTLLINQKRYEAAAHLLYQSNKTINQSNKQGPYYPLIATRSDLVAPPRFKISLTRGKKSKEGRKDSIDTSLSSSNKTRTTTTTKPISIHSPHIISSWKHIHIEKKQSKRKNPICIIIAIYHHHDSFCIDQFRPVGIVGIY